MIIKKNKINKIKINVHLHTFCQPLNTSYITQHKQRKTKQKKTYNKKTTISINNNKQNVILLLPSQHTNVVLTSDRRRNNVSFWLRLKPIKSDHKTNVGSTSRANWVYGVTVIRYWTTYKYSKVKLNVIRDVT